MSVCVCVCVCVCVLWWWDEANGRRFFFLFDPVGKASSEMQIPMLFYSLTTSEKYFDIGKPIKLCGFFFIFP